MSEIKTTGDVKELLGFLSSSMGLSRRLQEQCKEASKVLSSPLELVPTVKLVPSGQSAVTGMYNVKEVTDIHTVIPALDVISSGHNIGNVVIRRTKMLYYRIYHEILNTAPVINPWKHRLVSLITDAEIIKYLSNQSQILELVYVNSTGNKMIVRFR